MGNQLLSECHNQNTEVQRLPNTQTSKFCMSQVSEQNNSNTVQFIDIFPQRCQQINRIYQQNKNRNPITYSIENEHFIEYYGVQKLKQLQKFVNHSKNSYKNENNTTNPNFEQIKANHKNTRQQSSTNSEQSSLKVPDFKAFKIILQSSYSRLQSFSQSSDSKYIIDNDKRSYDRQSLFQDSFNQDTKSQKQVIDIYGLQYIYVGQVDNKLRPNGSAQLYHIADNNKSNTHINKPKSIFIQAQFTQGQINCRDCLIIFAEGHCFRGGFFQGHINGKGILKLADGTIEEGYFKNGQLEGKGKKIFNDGGIFTGFFKNGKRQGKGLMIWKSSRHSKEQDNNSKKEICFQGRFENDEMNGLGNLKTPNYQYWGPFVRNMKEGKGTIKFRDGRKFQGWFQKDQIHGYGQLLYPNGDVQKGQFPNKKDL